MPSHAATNTQRTASKRRKRRKNGSHTATTKLSEQDLADHVAHMYIHGPRGLLRSRQRHHEATLKELERHPSLVLNADYQPLSHLPLSLWNWQDVIKAVFSGKVTVVEIYDDVTIRAASLEVPLPSVIALNDYVPQVQQTPGEWSCGYC